MLEYLKKIFSTNNTNNSGKTSNSLENQNKKIQVAACALFIEMAKADGEYSESERKFIISEMEKVFNLDKECVDDLMRFAEQKIKESVSIYEFSEIINTTFSQEQKFELIKSLWKLIYQDKRLDAYEDQLIKRIAGTLNIEHKKIIEAKLLVKNEMGINKS